MPSKPHSSRLAIAGIGHMVALLVFTSSANGQVTEDVVIQKDLPAVYLSDNVGTPYIWKLEADHQSLDIGDVTNSGIPVRIQSTAPDFSFFIGSTGQIGFGTQFPDFGADMHAVDTGPVTIRLHDASTFGNKWDVEGSGNGFSVRDATGNTTPLTIQPAAPDNSLFITLSGQVGLGTSLPTAQLHAVTSALSGSESLARFQISDDPIGRLDLNNATASDGLLIPRVQGRSGSSNAALIMEGLITNDTGSNPVIVYNATRAAGGAVANRPLVVYRNNNTARVTVAANGNVTATAFINASSRSLKDQIVDLSSEKAAQAFEQLTPVEFIYKDDATAEKRVGFIAEDVPDLIAEPERKSVPVMDVVALVTRVVKDQQKTIDLQTKVIEEYRNELSDLTTRLRILEKQLKQDE